METSQGSFMDYVGRAKKDRVISENDPINHRQDEEVDDSKSLEAKDAEKETSPEAKEGEKAGYAAAGEARKNQFDMSVKYFVQSISAHKNAKDLGGNLVTFIERVLAADGMGEGFDNDIFIDRLTRTLKGSKKELVQRVETEREE